MSRALSFRARQVKKLLVQELFLKEPCRAQLPDSKSCSGQHGPEVVMLVPRSSPCRSRGMLVVEYVHSRKRSLAAVFACDL